MPAHHVLQSATVQCAQKVQLVQAAHQAITCQVALVHHALQSLKTAVHVQIVQLAQAAHRDII
jgi:ABC-type antimicrobial peptide transport system ATPase subunit